MTSPPCRYDGKRDGRVPKNSHRRRIEIGLNVSSVADDLRVVVPGKLKLERKIKKKDNYKTLEGRRKAACMQHTRLT